MNTLLQSIMFGQQICQLEPLGVGILFVMWKQKHTERESDHMQKWKAKGKICCVIPMLACKKNGKQRFWEQGV